MVKISEHCVKCAYTDFYHFRASLFIIWKICSLVPSNMIWYVDFVLCEYVLYFKNFRYFFLFLSSETHLMQNEHVLNFNGHVTCTIVLIACGKKCTKSLNDSNRWLALHYDWFACWIIPLRLTATLFLSHLLWVLFVAWFSVYGGAAVLNQAQFYDDLFSLFVRCR